MIGNEVIEIIQVIVEIIQEILEIKVMKKQIITMETVIIEIKAPTQVKQLMIERRNTVMIDTTTVICLIPEKG